MRETLCSPSTTKKCLDKKDGSCSKLIHIKKEKGEDDRSWHMGICPADLIAFSTYSLVQVDGVFTGHHILGGRALSGSGSWCHFFG